MQAAYRTVLTGGTKPTNTEWKNFGPASGDYKKLLAKLNAQAKMDREKWLQNIAGTPMPSGPYPIEDVNLGWLKGYITKDHQALYTRRLDVNLDCKRVSDRLGGIKIGYIRNFRGFSKI